VLADLPNLSDHEVYACGSPAMVADAERDFVNLAQLPPEQFFADAFLSELDRLDVIQPHPA
jgi:CDP-4-dehydro-6-deoxyglucose reductase